ncbi:hypothetical protein C8R43DRAFT_940605 [Mycena crocata]|nr:hypothetical protein C8R43DRAFT_940605 [Mycena crocata]
MHSSQTEDLEYKINAYPDLALLLSLTITEDPAKDCPGQMHWNTEINSKVVSFVYDDRRDTHSIQWPPKRSLGQVSPGVGRRLKQLLQGEGSSSSDNDLAENLSARFDGEPRQSDFMWQTSTSIGRWRSTATASDSKAFKAFLRQRNQEQVLAEIDFSLSAPGKVTYIIPTPAGVGPSSCRDPKTLEYESGFGTYKVQNSKLTNYIGIQQTTYIRLVSTHHCNDEQAGDTCNNGWWRLAKNHTFDARSDRKT